MPSHYDKPSPKLPLRLPTEKPAPPSQQEAVIKFAKDEGLPKAATQALLSMSEKQQRAFMAMAQETTQDLTTEDFRRLLNLKDEPRRGILTSQREAPPLAKQAYGGMMKPKKKKMMGGGMAGKKPRVGNMDYRKGGMVYSTKVKRG
jgi:hypothetical protein|tara:strand:- start:328 stop:765 length:438 start_codon:yes stop_codon:yes gene_type:complete